MSAYRRSLCIGQCRLEPHVLSFLQEYEETAPSRCRACMPGFAQGGMVGLHAAAGQRAAYVQDRRNVCAKLNTRLALS